MSGDAVRKASPVWSEATPTAAATRRGKKSGETMTYREIIRSRRGVWRRPRLAGSIRLEKDFDKYYTFYPEKCGLPEYLDTTSHYLMVHETFTDTDEIRQGDLVYQRRKRLKRHTFNSVRCFYENLGIGLKRKRGLRRKR